MTLFFGSRSARQIPGERDLAVLEMALRHVLGIAQIDLRSGRARCPECETAKLQPRRRNFGALANQIEGKLTIVRLGIVVQYLKSVDDCAYGTNEVVADA